MSSDATEALISMTKAKAPEIPPGTPEPKIGTDQAADKAPDPLASKDDDRDPAEAAAAAGP